jgi:hypothetical protein
MPVVSSTDGSRRDLQPVLGLAVLLATGGVPLVPVGVWR